MTDEDRRLYTEHVILQRGVAFLFFRANGKPAALGIPLLHGINFADFSLKGWKFGIDRQHLAPLGISGKLGRPTSSAQGKSLIRRHQQPATSNQHAMPKIDCTCGPWCTLPPVPSGIKRAVSQQELIQGLNAASMLSCGPIQPLGR